MRDMERIPLVLKEIEELWVTSPDLRFGQLVELIRDRVERNSEVYSLFNVEDDVLLEIISRMER